MNRSTLLAVTAAAGASLALTFAAQAQAPTSAQCMQAIEALSPKIDAASESNSPQKNEAEQLRLQANDMNDQGRYQECLDLVTQATNMIASK